MTHFIMTKKTLSYQKTSAPMEVKFPQLLGNHDRQGFVFIALMSIRFAKKQRVIFFKEASVLLKRDESLYVQSSKNVVVLNF